MDIYRVTDTLADPILATMAERLELRGEHPVFVKIMHRYLDALGLETIDELIEIGCGTGVVARQIAGRSDFTGRVTGTDRSPYLIAEARRLAKERNLDSRIEFELAPDGCLQPKNQYGAA